MMLREEEQKEITDEIARHEVPRAACVAALRTLQQHRGHISDEGLIDLAPMLGMTADELEGIATFYPFIFRRPVGRNIIMVCDGVTCWIMGYENLLDHLQARLGIGFGETTADERFTLLPVSCIGACDHAPAIMVNGQRYGDLDRKKIDMILDECP
jgi:NADH-quinone oxidoreductase subunit E